MCICIYVERERGRDNTYEHDNIINHNNFRFSLPQAQALGRVFIKPVRRASALQYHWTLCASTGLLRRQPFKAEAS